MDECAAFAEHYAIAVLPTKPYTPRHKGKVGGGVKYSQDNGLEGREFASLQDQNAFPDHWETNTAETRIHDTTRSVLCSRATRSQRLAL